MPPPGSEITILGGGPAGASAAIAAIREGARCRILERSGFPRHKVCGEFFSPEIQPELVRLGAWEAFRDARPSPIRRMKLSFGKRERIAALPEMAWGLSRYTFDFLMLECARKLGARVKRETAASGDVIASGRRPDGASRGRRLFGFKGHFEGPTNDAVELFFFDQAYVGVAPIENGTTNVCGLAPENFLRRFDFDYDEALRQSPALSDRLRPVHRTMEWLSTGPLKYGQAFDQTDAYLAGDALSFVDPFTGSGLLAAVKTGSLAGVAAARNEAPSEHIKRCRAALRQPFEVATIFRRAVLSGMAERLIGVLPARALFAFTRPR